MSLIENNPVSSMRSWKENHISSIQDIGLFRKMGLKREGVLFCKDMTMPMVKSAYMALFK